MILKTYCHLPVRRPAPKTSVQADDVIGGHRAGENSLQSQCNRPPRRAAVDTGSEKPGTLPRSPAIGTESDGPGISRFETSTEEEELFPLETTMDGFLNFTGTEQECILLKSDGEMDDNNDATTQQAAAREEFAGPTKKRQRQGTTAWAAEQNKQFDRGRSL